MRTKSFIALICLFFSGLLSLPHSFAITNGQEVEDIPLHNEAPPGNIPEDSLILDFSLSNPSGKVLHNFILFLYE